MPCRDRQPAGEVPELSIEVHEARGERPVEGQMTRQFRADIEPDHEDIRRCGPGRRWWSPVIEPPHDAAPTEHLPRDDAERMGAIPVRRMEFEIPDPDFAVMTYEWHHDSVSPSELVENRVAGIRDVPFFEGNPEEHMQLDLGPLGFGGEMFCIGHFIGP